MNFTVTNEKTKPKILIVDDSPINRSLLKEMFIENYIVLEAENGKVAYDIMQEFHNDISAVLLDIMMPVSDGYEVLGKMRSSKILSLVPVIVVTSADDEASQIKALECGAYDVITKPFSPEIVRHRVNRFVQDREEQLLDKNRQIEAIIANTPGGVAAYSLKDKILVREFVSESTALLFKCDYSELAEYLTDDFFYVVHPLDREDLKRALDGAIERLGRCKIQYRALRRDSVYISRSYRKRRGGRIWQCEALCVLYRYNRAKEQRSRASCP